MTTLPIVTKNSDQSDSKTFAKFLNCEILGVGTAPDYQTQGISITTQTMRRTACDLAMSERKKLIQISNTVTKFLLIGNCTMFAEGITPGEYC